MNEPTILRRIAAMAGVAALLALPAPAAAGQQITSADAPPTCAEGTVAAPGTWVAETFDGAGDVDWFTFTVDRTRPVRIVVGALSADAGLEVYAADCTTLVGRADHAGTRFEDILRRLAPGTYHAKVTAGAEATTGGYQVRVQRLSTRLAIVTSTVTRSGRAFVMVGDLYNPTSAHKYSTRVAVTFYSKTGRALGTATAAALDRRIEPMTRSAFRLATRVPVGTHHYKTRILTSSRKITDNDPLAITIGNYTEANGRIRIVGTARNQIRQTVRGARISAVNWNDRGIVFGVDSVFVDPAVMAGRTTGNYVLSVASCTSYGCATQLQGRARH